MSKMMDNLARVLEPEPKEGDGKKPSLFVVNQAAPSSTPVTRGPRFSRRQLVIWGVASALCLVLTGLLLSTFRGAQPARTVPVTPVTAMPTNDAPMIREGRFQEAKSALDAAVAANPGSRIARINRAYVLKELGDTAAAEKEYRAVLERFPNDAVVFNNLGALYVKKGRYDDAERALARAILLDEKYVDARINLAGLHERRQDWGAALKIFENLLNEPETLPDAAKVRERVRRLRSLSVGATAPKEKI